jgi:hypothetical protein
MGLDVAFFAAPDDEAALEAERRAGGPLGWPRLTGHRKSGLFRKEPIVTELGPAFDGFAARGYDPVVTLGTLEELLTGRTFASITDDPRSGGSPGDDEGVPEDHGVITLTDSLRDALASADDSRLAEVVGPWSQTEELQQPGWEEVTPAEHLEFMRALRDLARRAAGAGHRLYCYFAL